MEYVYVNVVYLILSPGLVHCVNPEYIGIHLYVNSPHYMVLTVIYHHACYGVNHGTIATTPLRPKWLNVCYMPMKNMYVNVVAPCSWPLLLRKSQVHRHPFISKLSSLYVFNSHI